MNWFCRLMSHDRQFVTVSGLEECVRDCMARFGVVKWRDMHSRSKLVPAAETKLENYYTKDGDIAVFFSIPNSNLKKVDIDWHPDDYYQVIVPRFRVEVGVRLVRDLVESAALEVFNTLLELFRPYWAELNDEDVTAFPTLCTLEGNSTCVPRFGTYNFFGNRYVEFLGGLETFKRANFGYFSERDCGVMVGMPSVSDHETYRAIRGSIEQRFPDPTLFDRTVRRPKLPYLGSGEPPENQIREVEIIVRENNHH
ncbi:MAG: hypothetical protein ACYC6Y_18755 [Thermoguttaceae bacterium]